MSVSTLKYCSAPLNWNIYLKFVSGQPLAEQYYFNFTWKSVEVEPILFLKILDLDMAVFCFVFCGVPWRLCAFCMLIRIFLSSTFLDCNKLCRAWEPELSQVNWGIDGVLWHKANWEISETALKRVSSRITHLFLLLSCPISSTISPDSYQHWYFDCDFDCVKISFSEKFRYPYWAKAWPLLCLNTFVTSGHNKDVTHHTRV